MLVLGSHNVIIRFGCMITIQISTFDLPSAMIRSYPAGSIMYSRSCSSAVRSVTSRVMIMIMWFGHETIKNIADLARAWDSQLAEAPRLGLVQNLDSGLWTGPWTGLWTAFWTAFWTEYWT